MRSGSMLKNMKARGGARDPGSSGKTKTHPKREKTIAEISKTDATLQ